MATKWDDLQHKAFPEGRQHQTQQAIQELENREVTTTHSPIFDPKALELLCRRDLPAALRQLADHLERNEISGSLWSFQGNGMVQDWRRAHFLMTLDLRSRCLLKSRPEAATRPAVAPR